MATQYTNKPRKKREADEHNTGDFWYWGRRGGGGRITGNDPGGRISTGDLYWNPPPTAGQNP